MAENRRDRDKRFYFRRGQLVLLGGAFTLASLIIFFLGIFVGKGIEERKIVKKEEPLVRIPVKPSAPGQSKEEPTVHNTVPEPPVTQPLVEDKPREPKPPEKLAKAEVKETKPAKEDALPPAAKVLEKKVEKSAPAAEAAKKSEMAETSEGQENGKVWTVQVNAFPDERSAKIWVDRLKNKGYNAYMTEAKNKGKTWFRVRVGKYSTRDEAETAVETLKSKENQTKAFAASK
jgi:cell division protein FtsN